MAESCRRCLKPGRAKVCGACRAQLHTAGLGFCNVCERALPLHELCAGLPRCLACRAAQWRVRYRTDPQYRARQLAKAAAYRAEHPDRQYARYPERERAARRAKYWADPEPYRAAARERMVRKRRKQP